MGKIIGLDLTAPDGVQLLRDAIAQAEAQLSTLPVRADHFFYDQLSYGFLRQAIRTARVILYVVEAGTIEGTEPTQRLAFEIFVDLVSCRRADNREVLSAAALIQSYTQEYKLRSDRAGTAALSGEPSIEQPPQLPATPEEFTNGLADSARRAGHTDPDGSVGAAHRHLASVGATREWHWSGLSVERRIEASKESGELNAKHARMMRDIVGTDAARSHALPFLRDFRRNTSDDSTQKQLDNRARSAASALAMTMAALTDDPRA